MSFSSILQSKGVSKEFQGSACGSSLFGKWADDSEVHRAGFLKKSAVVR
jgi:hypothetical protein